MAKRYLLIPVLVPVCLAGVLVALCVIQPDRSSEVEIAFGSTPSHAEVFEHNHRIGVTPLTIRMRRGEERTFRLLRRDCDDAIVRLRADDFLPEAPKPDQEQRMELLQAEHMVPLRSNRTASLAVSSDPPGAEVILDGRRRGRTPLLLGGLKPGAHALCLTHPECFDWSGSVRAEGGVSAEVRQSLKRCAAPLYRSLIEKDPGNIRHYGDLAHYHILQGEFREAEEVLRAGYAVAAGRRGMSGNQYFLWELLHTYIRLYDYPPERQDEKIRPVCRELMERAFRERVWKREPVRKWLDQMEAYDRKQRLSR